ncbi:MAG: hypothetical protein KF760_29520 [Candidatus Eremiobacteraeota bacterium]|nr:hypothetical protein [Candidatus Eremiobacteraeota bacterium]
MRSNLSKEVCEIWFRRDEDTFYYLNLNRAQVGKLRNLGLEAVQASKKMAAPLRRIGQVTCLGSRRIVVYAHHHRVHD